MSEPDRLPRRVALLLAATLGVAACSATELDEDGTPWRFELPPGIPEPYVPANNPLTAEKVELGRHLFFDERLSGAGTIACASCHLQRAAFADPRTVPVGARGDRLPHNSQSLTNAAYLAPLTWANPALDSLERQVLVPLFAEFPVEMELGGHEDEVFERLRDDETYAELFAAAYPLEDDPVALHTIRDAIVSFSRALVSADSPYDRYTFGGDATALSDAALRGRELFFSDELRCSECHAGFNFTVATRTADTEPPSEVFFNTGLYHPGEGYRLSDEGLFESTLNEGDRGFFRPPTLRNIALTGPYFHDGSARTLRDVIAVYERGGRAAEVEGDGDGRDNPLKDPRIRGFTLTDAERDDLIAFLESLTDETFISDSRFENPWGDGPAFAAPTR